MGSMFVYKIGKEYLNASGLDKNSGIWEFEKINEIARKCKSGKQILVCVGGLLKEKDYDWITEQIKRRSFDKFVFVMTDTTALEYVDLINKFDLVLHQSMLPIESIKAIQAYGYMPEMFYEEVAINNMKANVVLFGGNDKNRKEELNKYIFDEKGNVNDGMLVLLKKCINGLDNRIDHSVYLNLLNSCKYSLVVSSDWIYKHGWITSRMIEAFACNNIPIVSENYDKTNAYTHEYSRVRNYKDIQKILNGSNSKELLEELIHNKELALSRSNNFERILLSL